MAPWTHAAALAAAMLAVAAASDAEDVNAALAADDQCAAGDEDCALNALQLRASKQSELEASRQASSGNASSEWSGSCAQYGCGNYVSYHACQCNSACLRYGNCCGDYAASCATGGVAPGASTHSHAQYTLNWEASGSSFFNDFTFMTEDEVHGAHQFVDKATASRDKVAYTEGDSAILRVGGLGLPYKRKSVNIHTNKAWNPEESFVALLHYKHLPYGCGVWPGFWAMNSDVLWPQGGELDILEYANNEGSKVSFHTNKQCYLDQGKIYSMIHGGNSPGPSSCETDYFNAHPKLGCRPSQHSHTGSWWSNNPGIVGVEWTPEHVKVFHIPEAQIPADIHGGKPDPNTWDRFVIAYLPFNHGSCRNIAQPQELVLNLQLCGDWAGGAFAKTCSGARSGGCANDIWNPPIDCCTQFVMSPQGESQLREAYFDIKSLKVYTPASAYAKPSGTYMRGGVPLK